MNKMADNVLNKMNQKQQWEDEMIARYEKERESYQRNMEQKRLDRIKNDQEKMRNFLNQQMVEKRQRENDEKANIDIQAKMWDQDKKNYDEEERRLKERIKSINKDNASYLMQQVAAKNSNLQRMNRAEFSLNKPLLREANNKLKAISQYEGSQQNGEN